MALFLRGRGSGARVVITTWVLAATWVAVALLWDPAPPEPAPSASDQSDDLTSLSRRRAADHLHNKRD